MSDLGRETEEGAHVKDGCLDQMVGMCKINAIW